MFEYERCAAIAQPDHVHTAQIARANYNEATGFLVVYDVDTVSMSSSPAMTLTVLSDVVHKVTVNGGNNSMRQRKQEGQM
uniref:COPIIcoated_ERV domain-containing protein n=1 Tax=Steinernema glaseri TaxID=37863 RepID=A0A1I7YI93_9BILA